MPPTDPSALLGYLLILLAGVGAGAINAVVGSGTLITFPALLALGYPPVVANVSNTLGLVPGGFSGVYGYRRELAGQWPRLWRFGLAALLGGGTGATLLLILPSEAFKTIVPVLISMALVLIVLQPRLSKMLAARGRVLSGDGGSVALIAVYVVGIYGGYFGAAQGFMLITILILTLNDTVQRLNGLRNVLSVLTNLVAAVIFIFAAPIAWEVVVLVAIGSTIGGQLGAHFGRRLSPSLMRGVIVLVGLSALLRLLFS